MDKARAVNVRYTQPALVQIDQALSYVEARSPQGQSTFTTASWILSRCCRNNPARGARQAVPGVRRLPATPYPYLIDYRVTPTEIIIMRFRHAARRPIR
ncbi:type II toxin-antitoxin system RelE/ParE family toxin [Bradyrhizobium sp. USDA 4011]